MYPFEYLSYGTNDVGMLITRPSGAREYKVVDHLGSTRAVLDDNGNVTGRYDNEPFGALLAVTGADSRKGFIDRELDKENATYNTGVRQYDPMVGGFGSPDPLWENHRGSSPYHYALANPLRYIDGTGLDTIHGRPPAQEPVHQIIKGVAAVAAGYLAMKGGVALCLMPSGLSQIAGVGLITLGFSTAGSGVAILVDVADQALSEKKRDLREIPVGFGEGVGVALKNEYGWQMAPFYGSMGEGALTLGLGALNTAGRQGPLILEGVDLIDEAASKIGTTQQVIETVYDLNHPTPVRKPHVPRLGRGPGEMGESVLID